MEVTKRFKGLNLVERVPEGLWTEIHNTVQEVVIKTIPMKKKCKKVFWGGPTNSWENKRNKRQGRKGKMYPTECRVPESSKESKDKLLKWTMQRNKENNRVGKTRDLFKEIGAIKGPFHARIGTIKDRNGNDLTEAEETKMRWQELYRTIQKRS